MVFIGAEGQTRYQSLSDMLVTCVHLCSCYKIWIPDWHVNVGTISIFILSIRDCRHYGSTSGRRGAEWGVKASINNKYQVDSRNEDAPRGRDSAGGSGMQLIIILDRA